ncbi:MAG: trehalose-6-phosphate synthase [Bowdeniella nasicola]|nr:trehalose-6-phosphate synthase [Bowdeniella nasicola]
MPDQADFVVIANRLPLDVTVDDSGEITWERSPGGLVTAMAPVMQSRDGAWVGWSGTPDVDLTPFKADGMTLVPVTLSADEVSDYYEGFSNATLWPLYHDVIVAPEFHRQWWNAYDRVNRKFAEAAATVASEGATVWVHDYQLQLVPALLRKLRPDLTIGWFNHIPFPPVEIFSQLPWRERVLDGLLGADVLGFQRSWDSENFLRSVKRLTGATVRGRTITVGDKTKRVRRRLKVGVYPISIDAAAFAELAASDAVATRAQEIRTELGDPDVLLLGVDRLDYTKGIRHRLKIFGELLRDGLVAAPQVCLMQVASPSRERVEQYKTLRDEVEVTVGRINGDYSALGRVPVHYLHQTFPVEEMAAMYRAADVMLVTSLRDGMNLVAKEFVAAQVDLNGVLILSEFTGAADDLPQALVMNPHDIEGAKRTVLRALDMPREDRRRRMRSLRRRVMAHDVTAWADRFLSDLAEAATS